MPIDATPHYPLVSARHADMTKPTRILIVTAAFGEGHNSAAKNLAAALDEMGIENRVIDPCLLAAPYSTAALQWGYRLVTTHFPQIWKKIYEGTDRFDFSKPSLPMMDKPEKFLAKYVSDFQPDAVASTFPVYPYFLKRTFEKIGSSLPVFTVVTDSIEINASWLRSPSNYFLVTDQITLESMENWGIDRKILRETGFPVSPKFANRPAISLDDSCDPFRILYFPTAKKPFVRRHARALLEASPTVKITIVLGKNFRSLCSRAVQIKKEFPNRVRILGWTRKVPELVTQHHLIVGKAGGATVHEAIAATTPMLIHHLVPGQEEGNLQLLQKLGAGDLASQPAQLTAAVQKIIANDHKEWCKMKQALIDHNQRDGARNAANFILENI